MLPSSKTTLMPVKVPVKGKRGMYYSTRYKKVSEEKAPTIKLTREDEIAITTFIKTYQSSESYEGKFEKISDNVKIFKGSANGVFLIKDNKNKKWIYKPIIMENSEIRERKMNDKFYKREILAYKIYNIMKDNLKFSFPETKETKVTGHVGTLQEFVKAMTIDDYKKYLNSQDKYLYNEIDIDSFIDLQIYDYIIANDDRHYGNFLIDKNGKPYAIDNSLSFPSKLDEEYENRTRGLLASFIADYIEKKSISEMYEIYSNELNMTVYKRIDPELSEKIKNRIEKTAEAFLNKKEAIIETIRKEFKGDEDLSSIIEQINNGFDKLKKIVSVNKQEKILVIPQ